MRPATSLPDIDEPASSHEFVLVDVKQSKISLRLVGFVGKIKSEKKDISLQSLFCKFSLQSSLYIFK